MRFLPAGLGAGQIAGQLAATWTVFKKELIDALRDRRTLMMVIVSSVLMGPAVLVALSNLIGGIERQAEGREVLVAGLEHAPSLRNYIERQTFVARAAPVDHERGIRDSTLGEPVLVIQPDFELALAEGRMPEVVLLYNSTDTRAQASVPRLARLLQGFNSERATLHLAMRAVAPALLQPVAVQERDVAAPAARAARFTGMVPLFLLLAVLYGTLAAALDSTVGERERGSLEPLLATPASRAALVLGKWAAVTSVGLAIAVLSVLSFLPAQWLIRSDTLQAMFRFGPREALLLLALIAPLAGAVAALMMAIAIRCRTFKEAQTNNSLLVLAITLLPLVEVFSQGGQQAWRLAVPALAQTVLMNRVLKDEAIGGAELLLPMAACLLLGALALAFVVRSLRSAALR
jgi:sodium transport system permease protein